MVRIATIGLDSRISANIKRFVFQCDRWGQGIVPLESARGDEMISADEVETSGVVAIVRLDDLSRAVPLTEALIRGGVRTVEFTFTNPAAGRVIETVRDALGEQAFIGAG